MRISITFCNLTEPTALQCTRILSSVCPTPPPLLSGVTRGGQGGRPPPGAARGGAKLALSVKYYMTEIVL